jgi:hypothetical protein
MFQPTIELVKLHLHRQLPSDFPAPLWAKPHLVLQPGLGMCAWNPNAINNMRLQLVLRRTQHKCRHYPNEISALHLELVLRQIPRKSRQRRWQFQRRWRSVQRTAPLDSPSDEVIRVFRAPPGLGFLPPRRLALGFPTSPLPGSDS